MSERRPPPPAALASWVRRFGDTEVEARGEVLLQGALRALEAAMDRPGRDRDGAFALLAADALLTWACEDAACSADPETELSGILERVCEVGRG